MLGRNSEAKRESVDPVISPRKKSPGKKSSLALVQKTGVGIHTGKFITAEVHKSEAEGIQFSFQENSSSYTCPAHWERLSGTTRTTALVLRGPSRKKLQVAMIEHFMAAAHIWCLSKVDVKLKLSQKIESET